MKRGDIIQVIKYQLYQEPRGSHAVHPGARGLVLRVEDGWAYVHFLNLPDIVFRLSASAAQVVDEAELLPFAEVEDDGPLMRECVSCGDRYDVARLLVWNDTAGLCPDCYNAMTNREQTKALKLLAEGE